MTGYGLKLAGAAIVLLLAGALAMVIFGNIWARVGIGAAIVIVCGGLLLLAWNVDRKDRAKRQGLEDLPPI
jgi:Flp pilus assembly protein TadB